MSKFKYIVFKRSESSREESVIFWTGTNHNDIINNNWIVISAGFCCFNNQTLKIECYGESVSLNVKSREEKDSALLTNQYYEFSEVPI